MHLEFMKDVLIESGGTDTEVGKMVAAQDARAWPRPRLCGRCWAPRMCIVGQSLWGVFKVSS